jgi:DNA-binding beta-propeller fold protein YncE
MIILRKLKYLFSTVMLTLSCLCAQMVAQSVVANIPLGQSPTSIAVNSQTNRIYTTCQSPTTLKVVDGASNSVTATIPLNSIVFAPRGIAVNPTTNRIYVDDYVHGVWVLDGATNAILTTVTLPVGAVKIAVNPATNMIYVGNMVERTITVIDGNSNSPTENSVLSVIPLDSYNGGDIATNPVTNRIYVATNGYDFPTNKYRTITVIDGSTNIVTASPLHDFQAGSLALNTVTNRAYTVDQFDFKLEVLDAGDISLLATVTLGFGLRQIAVNPTTNRIHVTEPAGASVWIIDGSTNTYTNRLWLGLYEPFPISLAVNPQTSYVYVANGGGNPNFGGQSISVIDDPPAPKVQLQSLIERVRNYNLTNGISNSLDSKLQNALSALESMNSGNTSNVCNKLNSFINEVESHQELTTEQATDLINAGTRIRRTLGCG